MFDVAEPYRFRNTSCVSSEKPWSSDSPVCVAPVAHDCPNLIFRGFKLLGFRNLNKDDERSSAAIGLLIRRIRNVNDVIARETEYRTQRLEHTENEIRPPVDPDLLSDSPVSRRVAKKVLQHVWSNHADLASRSTFAFGPDATSINTHAVDIKHRDRIDAAYANVLRFLIGILDSFTRVRRDSDSPARRTESRDRFRVFMCHVFAPVEFDELLARFDDLRVFEMVKTVEPCEENVCATV